MKSILKSVLLVASGILISLGLLYGYSVLFKNAALPSSVESLRFVPIEPGDAVISHISGEVYLIREEKMIAPRPGDAVREGDVIKVVDDSWCQIQIVGKATMKLRSNTLVRIQRLLSSGRDTDFRTELLTGSMIYKVDRLEATDNLEVVAQERIFKVEGTEFFIEAFAGGSRVAVTDGKVAVLDRTDPQDEKLIASVTPGNSLDLKEQKEGTISGTRPISSEEEGIILNEGPFELNRVKEELIYLEITTVPRGADLYINGRLAGKNALDGLYPGAETLQITARKRGYRDSRLDIKPGDLTDPVIILSLTPLSLEESLQSEQEGGWPLSAAGLKADFEREKQNLIDGFSSRIEENQQTINSLNSRSMGLEDSIRKLEKSNTQLEKELKQSQEDQKKLRELLIQIQELSGQS